jgi:hypothetical protein
MSNWTTILRVCQCWAKSRRLGWDERRALFHELKSCSSHDRSLLPDQLQFVPAIRLRSRSVIWTSDPSPLQDGFRIVDRWRESWFSNVPVNGDNVSDPSAVPPGFDLKRQEWVILNRFCTSQGKCAYLMQWCIDGTRVTRRFAIVALLSRQQPIFSIAHWDFLKVVWWSCTKFRRRLSFI